MKKFLVVLLTIVLAGTLIVGCGTESASNSTPGNTQSPKEESPEKKPEVVKLRVAYHPNLFPLMIPGIFNSDISDTVHIPFASRGRLM